MILTKIVVLNAGAAEPEALAKAVERARDMLQVNPSDYPHWEEMKVEIHVTDRNGSGWLEYSLVRHVLSAELTKAADGSERRMPSLWGHLMVIGMIQRKPGLEYEFHS